MDQFLQFTIAHHLYIFPLFAGGMWLLTRWGAEPKRSVQKRAIVRTKKAAMGRGSGAERNRTTIRVGSQETLTDLQNHLAKLQTQEAAVDREIRLLEREAAGPGSGRKRKNRR